MESLSLVPKSSEPKTSNHDVRVEIRIKNNRLYEAIYAKYPSVHQFCVAANAAGVCVSDSEVGRLLNLKASPFKKGTQDFRSLCLQIEKFLRVPAEDLFPAKLYKRLGENRKVFTFNSSMMRMGSWKTTSIEDNREVSPDVAAAYSEMKGKLEEVLETLTYRERDIIKFRYGIGDNGYTYTMEEVGRIFNIKKERVRQIENKAISKLQEPVRARKLEGFVPKPVV